MFLRAACICALLFRTAVHCSTFDDLVAEAAAENKQWVELPTTPSPVATNRVKSWACTVHDKMYFFGGETLPDEDVVGDFWEFDFTTLKYTQIVTTPSPPPREKLRTTCDEARGLFYLVGGKEIEDLWIYNVSVGTWHLVPHDPVNGLSDAIFGSDFAAISTTDYIVIAGTDSGDHPDYLMFDKRTETFLPRSYDSRLKLEDPGAIEVGDLAVLAGGVRTGSILSPSTYVLNTTDPNAAWEEVTQSLSGEEFKMVHLYNRTVALVGDPGGKGALGNGNGVAIMDLDRTSMGWQVVKKLKDPEDWVVTMSDFMAVSYKGLVITFSGMSTDGTGGLSANQKMFAYNPLVCPNGCNGRGRCDLGNCVDCIDHSGVSCEIPDPVPKDYTPIIVGSSIGGGIVILLLLFGAWKASAKHRAYRRLYATNSVAENMAQQIARMELEKLDYLVELENPTSVQASFVTIVKTLKTYRMYLPESVLQTVQRSNETDLSDDEGDVTSATSQHSKSTKVVSGSKAPSSKMTAVSEKANHVHSDLAARVVKKNVGTAMFELCDYAKWVSDNSSGSGVAAIHEMIGVFADAVHTVISAKRGTILDAQLGNGRIVAAWNFQMPRAAPETCAADASMQVQQLVADTLPLKMRCAVTAGPCWAGNLGGSSMRVPAMVGKHRDITEILMKTAAARQLAVATNCESLLDNFKLVPVDIVCTTGYTSRSGAYYKETPDGVPSRKHGVWIFDVVEHLNRAAQEWMYELEEAHSKFKELLDVMKLYDTEGPARASARLRELARTGTSEQMRTLQESIEAV